MSITNILGNALRRDRFLLSLPVAETILRALVVYLLTLIDGEGGFGKTVWPKNC